jgi:hypothetical protein
MPDDGPAACGLARRLEAWWDERLEPQQLQHDRVAEAAAPGSQGRGAAGGRGRGRGTGIPNPFSPFRAFIN